MLSGRVRTLYGQSAEVNNFNLVRVVVRNKKRVTVRRVSELARERASRYAAQNCRLPRTNLRGIYHRQGLASRKIAREAVRVCHYDLAADVDYGDSHRRCAYGNCAYESVRCVVQESGSIKAQ